LRTQHCLSVLSTYVGTIFNIYFNSFHRGLCCFFIPLLLSYYIVMLILCVHLHVICRNILILFCFRLRFFIFLFINIYLYITLFLTFLLQEGFLSLEFSIKKFLHFGDASQLFNSQSHFLIIYISLENDIDCVILMIVCFDIFHHAVMFLYKTDWVMSFEISLS